MNEQTFTLHEFLVKELELEEGSHAERVLALSLQNGGEEGDLRQNAWLKHFRKVKNSVFDVAGRSKTRKNFTSEDLPFLKLALRLHISLCPRPKCKSLISYLNTRRTGKDDVAGLTLERYGVAYCYRAYRDFYLDSEENEGVFLDHLTAIVNRTAPDTLYQRYKLLYENTKHTLRKDVKQILADFDTMIKLVVKPLLYDFDRYRENPLFKATESYKIEYETDVENFQNEFQLMCNSFFIS